MCFTRLPGDGATGYSLEALGHITGDRSFQISSVTCGALTTPGRGRLCKEFIHWWAAWIRRPLRFLTSLMLQIMVSVLSHDRQPSHEKNSQMHMAALANATTRVEVGSLVLEFHMFCF